MRSGCTASTSAVASTTAGSSFVSATVSEIFATKADKILVEHLNKEGLHLVLQAFAGSTHQPDPTK
jgi:hypothetical protein